MPRGVRTVARWSAAGRVALAAPALDHGAQVGGRVGERGRQSGGAAWDRGIGAGNAARLWVAPRRLATRVFELRVRGRTRQAARAAEVPEHNGEHDRDDGEERQGPGQGPGQGTAIEPLHSHAGRQAGLLVFLRNGLRGPWESLGAREIDTAAPLMCRPAQESG